MADYISTRSEVSKTHFDHETVQVSVTNPDDCDPSIHITDEQVLKRICGAPSDSTIAVKYVHPSAKILKSGRWMSTEIIVTSPDYLVDELGYIEIYEDEATKRQILYLGYLVLRKDNPRGPLPEGFGARMLATIVDQARSLKTIDRIALMAAGGRLTESLSPNGDRWGGYFVWPDYGFDSALEEESLQVFSSDVFPYYPDGISDCASIRDVLTVEDGRNHWKVLGNGGAMFFDLSPGSWSINRLNETLRRRKI